MLTTKDIASELNVSDKTVRNWIDGGLLPAYKFGKEYRVERDDFEAFKNNSKTNGGN